MIKVVIFDLDGLLINSLPWLYKAYNQVYSNHGYPITPQEWEREWIQESVGSKAWIKNKNLPLDPEEIREEKIKVYEDYVRNDIELMPHANELIDELKDSYQLCIASATLQSTVNLIAEKFDFTSKFVEIISDSREEVKHRKPHPDVFLYVAKLMKVAPEECLVLEDSIAGLRAAKAAGMKCIACPDPFCNVDLNDYKEADLIVKNLSEINKETIKQIDL